MRTLIIEDEAQAISALKAEIQRNCPTLEILDTAATVSKAVEKVKKLKPELIFLDIQLEDGIGFSVLEETASLNYHVIFTTAYSNYALKAIKFSALDYLVKPIDGDDLKSAVEKAKYPLEDHLMLRVKNFIYNQRASLSEKKIALFTTEGIFIKKIETIIYLHADNNYTEVHVRDDKKFLVSKPLKYFENLLSEYDFERIHNSYIINLNHLHSFIYKDGGYVKMDQEIILPVSQRKRSAFIKKIQNFNDSLE